MENERLLESLVKTWQEARKEAKLQARRPSDFLIGQLDDENRTRVNIRGGWKVLDSTFDRKTNTGIIRFETTEGRVYKEEWNGGIRVRFTLEE